jgi:N-acylneuraminate cytidylyltransferase
MKNLAIIPARGGSKRIPRKNIKPFLGKPIIAYSIEAAINSKLFDEVMVSTDDVEIMKIALEYGASVPFLRSDKNSDDFATTADVLIEVIKRYSEPFEHACCIYPTAPFVNFEDLNKAYRVLIQNDFNSVYPIVRFSYPIQRSLKVQSTKVKLVWPEYLNSRSQDLEPRYHDAGLFYWFNVEQFMNTQHIMTENSGFIEIDELHVQDIDNEIDWKLAELKHQLINLK